MMNESIEQEDKALLNAYVPHKRASIYINQNKAELKRERKKSSIITKILSFISGQYIYIYIITFSLKLNFIIQKLGLFLLPGEIFNLLKTTYVRQKEGAYIFDEIKYVFLHIFDFLKLLCRVQVLNRQCLSYWFSKSELWTSSSSSPGDSLEMQILGTYIQGLPRWLSGKEPTCQCRRRKRPGFHQWVGKIPWWRAWQPTPVFDPRESYGQRSLADFSSYGHKESHKTEATQHSILEILN